MKLLLGIVVLVSVQAKKYILTPRSYFMNVFNYNSFYKEHNLDLLVNINDLNIYTCDVDNYNSFRNTLDELFEVEEDKMFKLPKPNETELVYLQNPGESGFTLDVPWHLDRIVKRDLPLNNSFEYNYPGSCLKNKDVQIHTYIVDTGIDVKHSEFEGRATWLANFADNINTDCNNHGTHCAGLVGSKSYGVCKDANLFAVKVLDCEGSGSYSGILSGLEFIFKRHKQQLVSNPNTKSIVSMSLGGGFSRAINRAVETLIKSDSMYVAVAAGNEDSDACKTSPASASGVLTIMASDKYDKRAYFSNYGTCADLYSPGVDILSTIPNEGRAIYSGTSMATPNLVGVLNHYLDQFPNLNMQKIKNKMMMDSSKNKLSENPRNTNNLLVYLNRS
jgi:subtilisin family serine protease